MYRFELVVKDLVRVTQKDLPMCHPPSYPPHRVSHSCFWTLSGVSPQWTLIGLNQHYSERTTLDNDNVFVLPLVCCVCEGCVYEFLIPVQVPLDPFYSLFVSRLLRFFPSLSREPLGFSVYLRVCSKPHGTLDFLPRSSSAHTSDVGADITTFPSVLVSQEGTPLQMYLGSRREKVLGYVVSFSYITLRDKISPFSRDTPDDLHFRGPLITYVILR